MSRIGDVMGEAHKNVQHVTYGQPGAPIAAIGKSLTHLGEGIEKSNKLRQKAADKKKKQAEDELEAKRQEEIATKIRPHLVAEVTRHVRRLNSANAGDATTVAQSQRLIAKFGSVDAYRKAISYHPEFKRQLHTVLLSNQFKARSNPSRIEYSGHASR